MRWDKTIVGFAEFPLKGGFREWLWALLVLSEVGFIPSRWSFPQLSGGTKNILSLISDNPMCIAKKLGSGEIKRCLWQQNRFSWCFQVPFQGSSQSTLIIANKVSSTPICNTVRFRNKAKNPWAMLWLCSKSGLS